MLNLIDNPPKWPNGARCAVCIAFDFDAESILHEFFPKDAPRRVALGSTFRFGAKVAVPRILKIFDHFNIKQTMFVPGWCVEQYPDVIKMIIDGGHEIAHHGWLHERVNNFSHNVEREILLRGMDAIEKATGRTPIGYRCPSNAFSENTLNLLLENGFKYDSSLGGHDIPYQITNQKGHKLIELPYDYSSDDWAQYAHFDDVNHLMPIRSPAEAINVFKADFEAAWQHGGYWAAVWHPFLSGRLARASAIVEFIEHMQSKGSVWFATMAEITTHLDGLIEKGEWSPMQDRVPFWKSPVTQITNS